MAARAATGASSVARFCRGVLESGDLDAKLAPPPAVRMPLPGAPDAGAPNAAREGPAVGARRPARGPGLEMASGADALPRPAELSDPAKRAACLARFAHHELMAVELFAWAWLRWPELPGEIRTSWLGVLADEQRHCRLYLERLRALGHELSHFAPHSDYFWRHVPAMDASPHGPRSFLCAMGLTLEQANLDFTLLYRDAFQAAGDEESALACQRVHDDEVRHVRVAAQGLRLLLRRDGPGAAAPSDEVAAYEAAVPYPLSAARAKGRRFDAAARRRAGLSDAFIAHVRGARSLQELAHS